MNKGHLHPMTALIREIHSIFSEMGFEIALGPELETEYYNFDALNVPKDHPARDMQDTFWLRQPKAAAVPSAVEEFERKLLRTHTSNVQIHYMEEHKPPFRIIVPGKVFRNEATDATHEVQFYQLEGLVADKDISLAHLKGVMTILFQKLFGSDVLVEFRPSFFPFTEPSAEIFMKWKGKWLEMGGAGLVHPRVFESVGVDSKEWHGFAFGFGLDRILMLKHDIPDVRMLYNGDLRLINQF